jgi:predicted amidohydrolase YtcJ
MAIVPVYPPMEFGKRDNDPVVAVTAFSATDPEAHVETLAGPTRAIAEDEFLEKEKNAPSQEELLALFQMRTSLMKYINPAEALGLAHRKGCLAPGYDADIVLLDEQGQSRLTMVRGEIV